MLTWVFVYTCQPSGVHAYEYQANAFSLKEPVQALGPAHMIFMGLNTCTCISTLSICNIFIVYLPYIYVCFDLFTFLGCARECA